MTDIKSESQTKIFNPLAFRKIRLGLPNCSSTQIIQSKESLADVGWKHPSRPQRRRTDAEGWPASGCLPVAMATEQTTSCVMSCRISATIAKSSGGLGIVSVTQPVGMNPTYRFSFIIIPPFSFKQLHYKISSAQDWNMRRDLQSALFNEKVVLSFFTPSDKTNTANTVDLAAVALK